MNMKPTKAENAAANTFLQPVIEGTLDYGARLLLVEQYERRTGRRIHRATIGRWLRRDASKRIQPTLGAGLLLREIFDKHEHERNKVK